MDMAELRILADENIPCVEEAFGQFGSVHSKSGRDIGPRDVHSADVLLVRSVTTVGPSLLDDSRIRFVGSATIGTDHVDEAYLRARDIPFVHAPGSNADSVADYVVVSLLSLAQRRRISLRDRTVGIVGCGNIGGRLACRLQALGMNVLRNDPPKAEEGEADGRSHDFVALDTVLDEAEVVTLHVPLKTKGPHPTHHLVDAEFLGRLNEGAWLVNTSRGAVVAGDVLLDARRRGRVGAAVLDVWEGEPAPDPALIQAVDVATPHIAGYAYDGKVRGTVMLYEAFCKHLGREPTWGGLEDLEVDSWDDLRCRPPDPRLPITDWLYSLARQAYNLPADDEALRKLVECSPEDRAQAFTRLRSHYRRRRELQQHTVPRSGVPRPMRSAVEGGLTIQMRETSPRGRD